MQASGTRAESGRHHSVLWTPAKGFALSHGPNFLCYSRAVAESVQYKKPRKFNVVVIAILGALALLVYLAWVYLPMYFRKSEAMRVLDETSSEFTGSASRHLADDKLVDKMLGDMRGEIQALGVSDPQAEYWIEIDSDDQVRFGVLYSDWIELPFMDAKEVVNELEMFCTRPGRGMGWTCEGRELDSAALGDELPQ
jgi:hypothetical protein